MNDYAAIRQQLELKLKKSLKHLAYTYEKVQLLPVDYQDLDNEQLETWESFAARFSRTSDLFLARYIRTRILEEDPGFEGTMRDRVNFAEKLGWIDDAREWMAIRELRNMTVHDYTDEELTRYFKALLRHAPRVLAISKVL